MKMKQLGAYSRSIAAVVSASMILTCSPVMAAESIGAVENCPVESVVPETVGGEEESLPSVVESGSEEKHQDASWKPDFKVGTLDGSVSVNTDYRYVIIDVDGGVTTGNTPIYAKRDENGNYTNVSVYRYVYSSKMKPILLPGKKETDVNGAISKVGFTFKGWKNEEGKKYDVITSGAPTTDDPSNTMVIKANWVENKYSIKYKLVPAYLSDNKIQKAEGSKISGKGSISSNGKVPYTAEVTLSKGEGISTSSFDLIGWSSKRKRAILESDVKGITDRTEFISKVEAILGDKFFELGAKVQGIAGQDKNHRKITLYPVWVQNTVKVPAASVTTTSGNAVSGNAVSGNAVSENAVSENAVSGNKAK